MHIAEDRNGIAFVGLLQAELLKYGSIRKGRGTVNKENDNRKRI